MLTAWGGKLFLEPHGLRIDSGDNIWVTDLGLHQVFKFSHDGRLLMTLGVARSPGQDSTHFNKPSDIAFGGDGSVYVADGEGNNRVAKFSADGNSLWIGVARAMRLENLILLTV
jgi:peptidylamidoglycolate lyase